jgi:Planctomycete cytochrome C/Leucine rich repeat
MMQFIWFLGRFHVLLVHLPLGILTLAVALEILVRFRSFRSLESAVAPAWIAGAISALVTVALGFMHATEESFEDVPEVEAHQWAGVTLAVVACLTAILRIRVHSASYLPPLAGEGREGAPPLAGPEKVARLYKAVEPAFARGGALDRGYDKLWGVPVAAILFLMFLTGHLGGSLTHGDAYLVQYAPSPIRVLAGLPADAGPRPKPADLASADVYLDVVQPAFDRRCLSCHNNSKKSGGLSVATYEALIKGGSKGRVITPGNPSASDLFRRVNLTPGRTDFMPKDGKTPLDKNEVAAIGWWISQGAPKSATVGSLNLTAEASSAIQAMIGAAGGVGVEEEEEAAAASPDEAPLPQMAEADKAAVAKVVQEGFIVRKVAKGSNLVDVDYVSANPVTPDMINGLASFGPNILRLNLRRAGVTDSEVKTVAGFPNLRRLRLEENAITDTAAADIAGLKNLTYLNLTNTKVTDAGLDQVSTLPKLSRLYVWGTTITPAAVNKVNAACKVTVYAGLTANDVPVESKIITPAN